MGLEFIARCRCDKCGKLIETRAAIGSSSMTTPFSWIRALMRENCWRQFGKQPGGRMIDAYYCPDCFDNDPDLLVRQSIKRLQGKEVL